MSQREEQTEKKWKETGKKKKLFGRQMERQQPWVAVTEIVLLYLKTTGVC